MVRLFRQEVRLFRSLFWGLYHDSKVAIPSDSLILRLSVSVSPSCRRLLRGCCSILVGFFWGLWEKQDLVAVVRGLEMYERGDLARGGGGCIMAP